MAVNITWSKRMQTLLHAMQLLNHAVRQASEPQVLDQLGTWKPGLPGANTERAPACRWHLESSNTTHTA